MLMNIGLRHVEGRGSRTQIVKKRDGEMETEGGRIMEFFPKKMHRLR